MEATQTRLHIDVVQPFGAGPRPRLGYVATLSDLTDGRSPPEPRRSMTLMVGGEGTEIAARPGRYRLEMILPSGDLREAVVELEPGERTSITLQGEHADDPRLGWQAASGNLVSDLSVGIRPPAPASRPNRRVIYLATAIAVIVVALALLIWPLLRVGSSRGVPVELPPPQSASVPEPDLSGGYKSVAPAGAKIAIGRRPGGGEGSLLPSPKPRPSREPASIPDLPPEAGSAPADADADAKAVPTEIAGPGPFSWWPLAAQRIFIAVWFVGLLVALAALGARLWDKFTKGKPFIDPVKATRARRAALNSKDLSDEALTAPRIGFFSALEDWRAPAFGSAFAAMALAWFPSGWLDGEPAAQWIVLGLSGVLLAWLDLTLIAPGRRLRGATSSGLETLTAPMARSSTPDDLDIVYRKRPEAHAATAATGHPARARTKSAESDPTQRATYILWAVRSLRGQVWAILTSLTAGYGLEGAIQAAGLQKAGIKALRLEPEESDERYEVFHIDGNDQHLLPGALSFVVSAFGNQSGELMVAPLPWGPPEASAVLDILAPRARDGRLSIAVQDPEAGTLLGYLTSGSLTEALVIARTLATGFLERKLENPFAAAAAGYVLIADPASTLDEPWRPWLQNLCDRFPLLPDGAILEGWNLLQRKSEGDLAAARGLFLEAFQRGLPVFTEGLRRLAGGLALFASDEDGNSDLEVRRALAVVDMATIRANPNQPITTLRLGD